MNVVVYARYSSHNQNEQSIEGQLEYCRNYAKGLFKTKVYQINVFHCNDCGAEWGSEPYEIS